MNDGIVPANLSEKLLLDATKGETHLLADLALKSFTTSQSGTILLDADCNLLFINDRLASRLGYTAGQLTKMNLQALVHPGELLLCMHHLSQLISGELPRYETDMRWIRTDGEIVWMNVHAFEVKRENGSPHYICMHSQEISALKQTEAALRESQLIMASMLETIADAYLMLDRNGRFIYVNRSAEMLLQRSRAELLGRTLSMALPEWIGSSLYKACQRAMEDASPVFVQEYYAHTNRWIEANCSPCKPGVSVFIRDVTLLKEQEETLRTTKQQLDSMIEHTADHIAILDSEFKLVRVNRAFIRSSGFSEQELIGQRLPTIPEELWIETELLFRQAFQGKQISQFETVRRCKNGSILDISLTLSPIVGPEHDITGICMIGRDISEHKKTEEHLRNSEKLAVAGQLAAGVAHEIRNPLTSLKGFTQFLKSGAKYKDQYLDIMISELERIDDIIGELLMLARPPSAVFQNNPISPILTHVISLLEPGAHLNNVQFTTYLAPDLPMIYCEENQLKQVFINILKNAIEAMPRGGNVDITAGINSHGELSLTFRDEGEGIPAELVKRLGEPFYTTKAGGSGLGLMVSQKIITEHNGRLSIESTPGQGTIVAMTIPTAAEDFSEL
ncbi:MULTISPECIES: PAS domain-containing sensor histidine kinase [unclassified Paenibacillus]|uniref:PAS domain-containing sensor histidine kinase n=1 Tax=unclassified Paenibacillus TaxID=185978 RepID=UPI001AE6D8B7|nr:MULTISPECIES: PAS domain-containing sensor histidine kinase [unclassified Paenibacillus]MBP1153824.1 PAS domain S-box-containing protein [Paenibacillus sp. PvP091]MBP1170791.1 PAS domain S-box-containing protein [Paenibacillus sp. PvR098]MBP2441819.1 PAS domain S-box-containing protein [Paenibacillus sp. PvP052]